MTPPGRSRLLNGMAGAYVRATTAVRSGPGGSYHAGMTEPTSDDTSAGSSLDPSEEPLVGRKPRSYEVTDGPTRAPARAMLRAVGMTDDDWDKPQIGVASSWNEVTPCNMPLDRLAKRAKEGVRRAGGFPLEFVTIAVSDGISMGHEGMRASLVSREVIADSVETMMHAERFDGMVTLAGCDKSLPGMLMAAARLNLPCRLPLRRVDPARPAPRPGPRHRLRLRGGRRPRRRRPDRRGAQPHRAQRLSRPRDRAPGCSPPTPWRRWPRPSGCRFPGTLVGAGRRPPPRRRRLRIGRGGRGACSKPGIRPRQIMTKPAFENAIAVVMALGGSTNAVLHLLAIANEARVELALDDFNEVAARVPHLADTKPHGRFHMVDLDRIGGVPVVMRELLDAGLLDGDCLTVTGRTVAENLAALDPPAPDGEVVHAARPTPIHATGRDRRPPRLARPQGRRW